MSSYISPAPQGDAKATGAYAVAIAATAGGVNNDGHATDSAGNVAVDFSWGNFPLQPNDVRDASVTNYGGSTGDTGWSQTTQVANGNLAYGNITKTLNNGITKSVKPDSHEIAESAYAGYPAFVKGNAAVYIITQASGDGSTQTYTCPNNFLAAGDTVNITGTGLDGDGLTVATANRYTFTVSGSGTGTYINITGRVRYADEATANDGAYIDGVAYIKVPSVINFTTAKAQETLLSAEFGTVTVASGATNSTKAVDSISRTEGSTSLLLNATSHGFSVGEKLRLAATGDSALDADYTVASGTSTNQIVVTTTATSAVSLSGLSATAKRVPGTIKTQSPAANASSISAGATVTITPWA